MGRDEWPKRGQEVGDRKIRGINEGRRELVLKGKRYSGRRGVRRSAKQR